MFIVLHFYELRAPEERNVVSVFIYIPLLTERNSSGAGVL